MVQNKNIKVVAKYNGTVAYTDSRNNKFNYHLFTPVNKTNDLKWIKVHEKNPIISSLELKEEGEYELNWIEKNRIRKRVFNKNDNIVVISQKQKTPPNSIENNQCANCQKDICKKGEGSATKYFITLDGREIYENKHWCSNCLPVVKSLCEIKMWGVNKDDIFGSNLERLHKSKVSIKTVNGKDTLVVDLNHQSPWTCPWCDKTWKDSESKQAVLDHYSQTHQIGKTNDEESPEEDKEEEQNQPTPDVGVVRKYCRDNGIDRLEYDEKTGKLLVIYKTNKPIEEKEALTEELERIREYVKKKGRTKDSGRRYITDEDWNDKPRQENPSEQKNKTNWTPWVIAGGIGLFAIVLIAVIGLVRKGGE